MHTFSQLSKTIRALGGVAAGVDGAVVTLPEIDMLGFGAVRIILIIGTISANGVLTTQVKNSGTTATYGAGTIDNIGNDLVNVADTDDNKVMIWDIHKPRKRFLQPQYKRTVGNVVIDAVIYELYNPGDSIVTPGTTNCMSSQFLNGPIPSAT